MSCAAKARINSPHSVIYCYLIIFSWLKTVFYACISSLYPVIIMIYTRREKKGRHALRLPNHIYILDHSATRTPQDNDKVYLYHTFQTPFAACVFIISELTSYANEDVCYGQKLQNYDVST